ncbi:MAG: DUF7544 domain-containing protein [Ktedonobacterales bacterium]
MSGSGAALVSIPLRDGTQLSVTPAGIQLGERFFEVALIQDARQVSPEPETFALRVSGAGLVEFQPLLPGDGVRALDTLFHIRPDLRPAGFVGPSEDQRNPPPPYAPPYTPPYTPLPYGPAPVAGSPFPPPPPGYGASLPGAYPPPAGYGYAPPAPPRGFYGPSPNIRQGELTPYPRSFGETLSAIFQLYGKHLRSWLALGLWVVFLPGILLALVQVEIEFALGLNPFATTPIPQFAVGSNCLPVLSSALTRELTIVGAVTAGTLLVGLLISAWQNASFANAGREAVLNRPIPIAASMRRGARRLFPTLGASIAVILITLAALAPGIACFVFSLVGLAGSTSSNLCATQTLSAASTATPTVSAADSGLLLLNCLGLLLFLAGSIVALFLAVRLFLAPVIAATERAGVGTALSRSWRLTRGSWWRSFGVILVITIVVGATVLIFSALAGLPLVVAAIVAIPLGQWLIVPLQVLAYIVLLFDLRLRREGYGAVTQAPAAPVGAAPFSPPDGSPPAQD